MAKNIFLVMTSSHFFVYGFACLMLGMVGGFLIQQSVTAFLKESKMEEKANG